MRAGAYLKSSPLAGTEANTRRLARLPMLALMLLGAITVSLVGTAGGPANLDLAVKGTVAIITLITAASIVLWRPAVFPFAFYLAAVPFDNLLQTGLGTITKFLAAGSMLAFLLLMTDRRRTMTPPLVVFAWLAFLIWSIASLTWAEDLAQSFYWLNIVLSLFGLFLCAALLRIRVDEVRVFAAAVIAGGVACAIYGYWMYAHGTMVANATTSEARLNITYGTAGSINADHFAGALVFPIALALVWAMRGKTLTRIVSFGALLVMFVGVFIAATRGAVVAIGAIGLYLLIFSDRGRKELLVTMLAGFSASLTLPSVWLRFTDPTQGAAGGRFDLWKVAWQAFRDHFVAGVGAGNFRTGYSDAYLKVFQDGVTIHPWFEDAHNLIASTSVELGIVGLLLLGAGWYFQFRSVSVIPRDSKLFDLRLAAEAGLIGLFIIAMTVDVFFYKYLWLGFTMAVLIRNAYVGETQVVRDAAMRRLALDSG